MTNQATNVEGKEMDRSKGTSVEKLVKEATRGLIGDGATEINMDTVESRVRDQADRFGVFYPSWPTLVGATRNVYGKDSIVPVDESTDCGHWVLVIKRQLVGI